MQGMYRCSRVEPNELKAAGTTGLVKRRNEDDLFQSFVFSSSRALRVCVYTQKLAQIC